MAKGNTLCSTQALGRMWILVSRGLGCGWGATSPPLNLLRQNGEASDKRKMGIQQPGSHNLRRNSLQGLSENPKLWKKAHLASLGA